jgi:GTP-binding protein Era
VNALVGQKVAIASDRPQTTRHTIRGIVNRPDAQLILVDTPGLHRPRTLLGSRLNDLVRDTWSEVDLIVAAFPSDQRVGPGDNYLVSQLASLPKQPQFVALATKTDLVSKTRLREHLMAIARLGQEHELTWQDIVPVSALTGDQVDEVADVLLGLLPPGPQFYLDGEATDEPTERVVAELIREAVLELVNDELPHSIAVTIEEMGPRAGRDADRPLLDIYAAIVVERDSQKPIVLGAKAARLKHIGTVARQQISRLFGTPVYLDLRVKVLKDWQRDPKKLARLGF